MSLLRYPPPQRERNHHQLRENRTCATLNAAGAVALTRRAALASASFAPDFSLFATPPSKIRETGEQNMTPILHGTKKTVTVVNHDDVDIFVTRAFPELSHLGDYQCAYVEEYSNDTLYEKSIFPMPGFDNYATKYRIGAGQWPSLRDLLNVACGRGLIEAGNYLIKVSW